MPTFFKFLLVFMNGLLLQTVFAQGEEAFIRKTLKERMPHIRPIDEIKRTPMPGLFELRVDGSEIYYTDASANFLIQGHLIDTKIREISPKSAYKKSWRWTSNLCLSKTPS